MMKMVEGLLSAFLVFITIMRQKMFTVTARTDKIFRARITIHSGILPGSNGGAVVTLKLLEFINAERKRNVGY